MKYKKIHWLLALVLLVPLTLPSCKNSEDEDEGLSFLNSCNSPQYGCYSVYSDIEGANSANCEGSYASVNNQCLGEQQAICLIQEETGSYKRAYYGIPEGRLEAKQRKCEGEGGTWEVNPALPPVSSEADLDVQYVFISNSIVRPGQEFSISFNVRNRGSSSSNSATLKYYYSDHTMIFPDGALPERTDGVSALNFDDFSVENTSLTAPHIEGLYFYRACVDPVVGETNIENNCSKPVQVAVSSTLTPIYPPSLPAGVSVVSEIGQVGMTWYGVDGATSYEVHYKEALRPTATWIVSNTGSANVSYTITGLRGGTLYEIQVRALNGAGSSDWSESVETRAGKNYDSNMDDLIEINSLDQLYAVRYDLDGDGMADNPSSSSDYESAFPGLLAGTYRGYELVSNLDFNTSLHYSSGMANRGWSQAEGQSGWKPIGDSLNGFTATFDGKNRRISNLYINRSTTQDNLYGGLFGYTGGSAIVQNLNMADVNINVSSGSGATFVYAYAGGLMGYNEGEINNCTTSGSVSSNVDSSNVAYAYSGGLVGENGGSIRDSSTSAEASSVTSTASFGPALGGGLVARNNASGTIQNSYATGTVEASSAISFSARGGGLVGDNIGAIYNCYAIGMVTVSASPGVVGGGLVGLNDNTGIIYNSYAEGDVEVTSNDPEPYGYGGGLVGLNNNGASVTNSYAEGNVTVNSSASDPYSYGGGLVGVNDEGTISNSYAVGDVEVPAASAASVSYGGGLLGLNSGGTIRSGYAVGDTSFSSTPSSTSSYAGGLLGGNSAEQCSDSMYSTQVDCEAAGETWQNEGIINGTNYFVWDDGDPSTTEDSDGVGEGMCANPICESKTLLSLQAITSLPSDWDASSWNWGSSSQRPGLRYSGGATICGTVCGNLIPGQR